MPGQGLAALCTGSAARMCEGVLESGYEELGRLPSKDHCAHAYIVLGML